MEEHLKEKVVEMAPLLLNLEAITLLETELKC